VSLLAFVESNTTGTGALFVERARRLGLRPVLLTRDPDRYPFAAAGGVEVVEVETTDAAAVLARCRRLAAEEPVAGVASSSEYFLETAAVVADALGLAAPEANAIHRCREKDAQRICLRRAGLPVPRFGVATSPPGAARLARDLGSPVVVKPTTGSGSVGVRLCADPGEAALHAEALLAQTGNERGLPVPRRVLVEQYVVGLEYSAEVLDGEIVGLTAKHLGALPEFVELGHDYPATLEPDERAALCETVEDALSALGLRRGPAHVELRLGAGGPVVVEVNARLAGGFIPELVRESIGVDLVTETIRSAIGASPRLEHKHFRHASIRFLTASDTGTLVAAEGLEEARRLPYVVDVRLYRTIGERVVRSGDFRERIGHVLTAGTHGPAVAAVAEGARSLIRPVVAAEPKATAVAG
jgi:S-sulfo-L-cysteine synthase (3-phospho-L-serine-dependent)